MFFCLFAVCICLQFIVLACSCYPSIKTDEEQRNKRSHTTRESELEKQQRIGKAKQRKIRSVCGWNVFQREALSDKAHSKGEYTAKIRALSAKWRAMSKDEKAEYDIKAAHQQSLLDSLEARPLPVKGQPASDSEGEQTWRNAKKKRSARRLDVNAEAFEQYAVWDWPTRLGDSLLAARVFKPVIYDTQTADIQSPITTSMCCAT